MRSIRRLLTATAVSVAMAAASIAVAGPAAASPEDGEGCVGTPVVPASYVCVLSLTPGNAVPTVDTSDTTVPVNVPPLCYFLDCTAPTTVNVPVPGVGLNDGDVVVLWHLGKPYPIGLGIGGQVVSIALGAVALAGQVANDALVLAGQELAEAQQLIADLRDQVPTSGELLEAIRDFAEPYQDAVDELVNNLPTTQEILREIRDNEYVQFVLWIVAELRQADWCSVVAGVGGLVTGPDAWSC